MTDTADSVPSNSSFLDAIKLSNLMSKERKTVWHNLVDVFF